METIILIINILGFFGYIYLGFETLKAFQNNDQDLFVGWMASIIIWLQVITPITYVSNYFMN